MGHITNYSKQRNDRTRIGLSIVNELLTYVRTLTLDGYHIEIER